MRLPFAARHRWHREAAKPKPTADPWLLRVCAMRACSLVTVDRLTGTVPNQTARVTAATTARATRGVKAVLQDGLQIKTSKAAMSNS